MSALGRTCAGVVVLVAVSACAASKPVQSSTTKATWPEGWGIQFALRCTSDGNDARLCACLADRVQKRWTPEEFKSVAPGDAQEEIQVCRSRLLGEED